MRTGASAPSGRSTPSPHLGPSYARRHAPPSRRGHRRQPAAVAVAASCVAPPAPPAPRRSGPDDPSAGPAPARDRRLADAAARRRATAGLATNDDAPTSNVGPARHAATWPTPGNWVYSSPVVATVPALGKQLVFVGNKAKFVFAFDAATGELVWRANVQQQQLQHRRVLRRRRLHRLVRFQDVRRSAPRRPAIWQVQHRRRRPVLADGREPGRLRAAGLLRGRRPRRGARRRARLVDARGRPQRRVRRLLGRLELRPVRRSARQPRRSRVLVPRLVRPAHRRPQGHRHRRLEHRQRGLRVQRAHRRPHLALPDAGSLPRRRRRRRHHALTARRQRPRPTARPTSPARTTTSTASTSGRGRSSGTSTWRPTRLRGPTRVDARRRPSSGNTIYVGWGERRLRHQRDERRHALALTTAPRTPTSSPRPR